jgi:hypothetical protein
MSQEQLLNSLHDWIVATGQRLAALSVLEWCAMILVGMGSMIGLGLLKELAWIRTEIEALRGDLFSMMAHDDAPEQERQEARYDQAGIVDPPTDHSSP